MRVMIHVDGTYAGKQEKHLAIDLQTLYDIITRQDWMHNEENPSARQPEHEIIEKGGDPIERRELSVEVR